MSSGILCDSSQPPPSHFLPELLVAIGHQRNMRQIIGAWLSLLQTYPPIMRLPIRLLAVAQLIHHGVAQATPTVLQEISLDVRLEATFGTLLFCDDDIADAVRDATRTCLAECEGLVAFHTAECILAELAPAPILGGTRDEIRLFGDILGDQDVIASTSLCLREQISSPSCVAAVQRALPNVAGLEYTGGLDNRRTQEPTAIPAIQEPVPFGTTQTLVPAPSPVVDTLVPAAPAATPLPVAQTPIRSVAPTLLPSQFPSTMVLAETPVAPPTITLTRAPTPLLVPVPVPAIVSQPPVIPPTAILTRAPTPLLVPVPAIVTRPPAISPTLVPPRAPTPPLVPVPVPAIVTRPPVVRRTPAPSWMFTRRPTATPPNVVVNVIVPQPPVAVPAQQPTGPSAVPGNMLVPSGLRQPTAAPTEKPSMFDESSVSTNLRQPTPFPSKLTQESPSIFGDGSAFSPISIIILAALLVMTSSILFVIGLCACCKTRRKRRRAAARRRQRDRWDADRVKIEHTLPLTRSTKSKRGEVSETENDGLSSVSSFHPSEYSSSSGDGIDDHDDDDDDQWALYSVISGVSSAGVSRVSFACNHHKKKKLSTRYEGQSS